MVDNVNDLEKSKYIAAARNYKLGGRPRAFDTPEELRTSCQEYLDDAANRYAPLTMAGLAAYLGKGRMTIIDYASGKYDTPKDKYSCAIKEVRSIIEGDKVEKSLNGLYNSTMAIFDLKNNHDYKNESDVNNRYVDKDGEDLTTKDQKIIKDYEQRIMNQRKEDDRRD